MRQHPDTKTKRWQGIVKYPDLDPDKPGQWKTRAKTFDKKADAQAWVDETLSEHHKNPTYKPPSDEGLVYPRVCGGNQNEVLQQQLKDLQASLGRKVQEGVAARRTQNTWILIMGIAVIAVVVIVATWRGLRS